MSENVEIILNGVNVSGCEYLNNSKEGLLCTLEYDYKVFYDMCCSDNPDCYYKQLQRERQKNKELIEDCNELEQRHNGAFEDFEKIKKENKKLRKTLKEVEEMAEAQIFINDYCPITIMEKILKKIKEVENNNVS